LLGHLEINLALAEGELERGEEARLVVEFLHGLLEGAHAFAGGEDLVHLGLVELGFQLGDAGGGLLVGNAEGLLVALELGVELLADLGAGVDGGDEVGVRLAEAGWSWVTRWSARR